jgi:hypothetical protein
LNGFDQDHVSYLPTVYFTQPDVRGCCERASDPFSPGSIGASDAERCICSVQKLAQYHLRKRVQILLNNWRVIPGTGRAIDAAFRAVFFCAFETAEKLKS